MEMQRKEERGGDCGGMSVVHGPRSTNDNDAVVGRPIWEHRIGFPGLTRRCKTAHDAISSHTCGHVAPEALTLLLLIDLQESYRPDGILISESRIKIKSDWNH